METQKIFKNKDDVVIISEYREKEVLGHLKKMDARINEMSLEIGDFICSKNIAIERKSHSDFISSIIDGRIFVQIKNLKENFKKAIIIIEGSSNREINDNVLKAALARLVVDNGVSLINTKNSNETAKMIYWISKKEQVENKQDVSFKVGKKSKEKNVLQEQIISGLPGVSNVISQRLLEHFGSVENVITADEMELEKVEGVGKSLSRKIKKIIADRY